MSKKEVILTGLRSNSEFHIGNYLGAILPMVELQKKHAGQFQLNMFVPDLHSFTTPIDHGKLYEQTMQNLKVFVAAGLDIDNSDTFIYRQSYIPAHSELTWVISCFTSLGELERMTQFKDKVGMTKEEKKAALRGVWDAVQDAIKNDVSLPESDDIRTVNRYYDQFRSSFEKERRDKASAGLYAYPILMAADILLYDAKWVPVGDDQRQHLEFTRDLATRLNHKFGELFTVPEDNVKQQEFSGRQEPVRIRSLRSPEKKMSKSTEDPAGTIMLSDEPEAAAKKVMEATTDSIGTIHYDWEKQPGVTNLLQILDLLTNSSMDKVMGRWQGKSSYGELKTAVAEAVRNFLSDFQTRLEKVDEADLVRKLEADEEAMRQVAESKLLKVQKAVGLRPKD
jgi:tryptophanyl-tRNA synthetase